MAAPKTTKKSATTRANGVVKKPDTKKTTSATKKTAVKEPPKTKAPLKSTSAPSKNPPNTSRPRKRKLEEETEATSAVKAPKINGASKTKKATAPRKTRTAKSPKPSATLHQRPTQPLKVYVFGSNQQGELGLGEGASAQDVKRPRLNPNLDPSTIGVVQVSAGGMHTAALTQDGKILTWGVNDLGALGRNTDWSGGLRDISEENSEEDSDSDEGALNPKESSPTAVDVSSLKTVPVFVQVAAGDNATFALTDQGEVYGWGTFKANDGGTGFSPEVKVAQQPTHVPTPQPIRKIAVGSNHILALTVDGTVLAWGNGEDLQLGRVVDDRTRLSPLEPHPFGLTSNFIDIGTGASHSFAIHKNGSVYAWGKNNFCQTGIDKSDRDNIFENILRPTPIKALKGRGRIVEITGGKEHTIAATESNTSYTWGRLDTYALGIDFASLPSEAVLKNVRDQPVILKQPIEIPDLKAKCVAASSDHTILVTTEGKAYSSGFSGNHQTGQGTDEDVEMMTLIDNTAVREQKLVWAGCGGQYSILAAAADSK